MFNRELFLIYEDSFLLQLCKVTLNEQHWDEQDIQEALKTLERVLPSLRSESTSVSLSFEEHIIFKHLEAKIKNLNTNKQVIL